MKTIALFISLLGVLLSQAAVRPELVPSRLTEIKSNQWYVRMFESWNDYLDENPLDKEGWVEYFKAGQLAGMPKEELIRISTQIGDRFSESAESHLVQFKTMGWTEEGVQELNQCIVASNANDFLVEKLLMAEYQLDQEKRAGFSQAIYQSELLYPSLLNYSYNVLMSVEENGVLFTQGENTTVPLYILQDAMGIRTDVGVVNLELAKSEDYLIRKLDHLGLDSEPSQLTADLGRKLPAANPERKFYYALTMPRQNLEQVEDRLYVVGLTSQLSEKEIDNYSILKENIERNFLLDYLSVDFNGEPKTATGRKYEANYTVPFLMLKKYYDETGNVERSNYWREKVVEVAERNGQMERVETLLGAKKPLAFKPMNMDVESLEKNLVQVKGKIYAHKFEVTNEDYSIFLEYLDENGYDDLYDKAAYDFKECDAMSVAMRESYHYFPINVEIKTSNLQKTRLWEKSQYKKYPTLDMTHEAAKLYCDWLTEIYHQQKDRQYKKVKFRLPTKTEWTMAALGYKEFSSWSFEDNRIVAKLEEGGKKMQEFDLKEEEISYPWGIRAWELRNTVYNRHRCILANVKMPQVITCPAGVLGDGFRVTSPVGTYFSNEMGLFDVVGNVAEMIDEAGKAMGGSWNHPPEESTIHSMSEYDSRSTDVGFRIFMEVIEE